MTFLRPLVLLPLLALAACNRSQPEADGRAVQRVLPGTVSDAMLQTDRIRAQAPIAEPVATGLPGDEGETGRRRTVRRPPQGSEQVDAGGQAAAPPPAAPAARAPEPAETPAASPTP